VVAAAPALFVIGVVAFRAGPRTRIKDLGRVAIGLGLVLVALHVLSDTLAPAENAPSARTVLRAITSDPAMCILIAAALTWAAIPALPQCC
jgi:phosphate:Na+ symporter